MLVHWAGPPENNSHSSNSAGGVCRWVSTRVHPGGLFAIEPVLSHEVILEL